MKIKVLSWNIWGGYFVDLPGVIKLLKKESPDIIGLQEVKSNGENQAETISDSLGYSLHDFRVFSTDRHEPRYSLGNSVLTKGPIKSADSVLLSELSEYEKNWETEPRGIAKTILEINGEDIQFLTVHLAYSIGFKPSKMRIKQVKNLVNNIPEKLTILAGDFNSLPSSEEVKLIESKVSNADKSLKDQTWPVRNKENPAAKVNPNCRIDYIFVSSDIKVIDFKVIKDYSSDHFPIMATLEV